MNAIVVGSSGTIGHAIRDLLKEKGYEVIEASRSTQPAVNIEDTSSIDSFYASLQPVDVIVSAAGSAAYTALDQLTDEEVQMSVNSKLLGQVNLVRKGLSKLKPNGVFVITGGILAYTPGPQTSMYSMVNAGLEGFAKAAAFDLTEGRRIVIVHPPWVAETATKLGMDPSPWPNAAKTAKAYLAAIEGSKSGEAVFVEGHKPA